MYWQTVVREPNFWYSDPSEKFFHLSIYGELFGDAMAESMMTGTALKYAQPANRLAFVRYCVTGLLGDADDSGLGRTRPEWTDSMLSLE